MWLLGDRDCPSLTLKTTEACPLGGPAGAWDREGGFAGTWPLVLTAQDPAPGVLQGFTAGLMGARAPSPGGRGGGHGSSPPGKSGDTRPPERGSPCCHEGLDTLNATHPSKPIPRPPPRPPGSPPSYAQGLWMPFLPAGSPHPSGTQFGLQPDLPAPRPPWLWAPGLVRAAAFPQSSHWRALQQHAACASPETPSLSRP